MPAMSDRSVQTSQVGQASTVRVLRHKLVRGPRFMLYVQRGLGEKGLNIGQRARMITSTERGVKGRAFNVVRQLRTFESETICTRWTDFADIRVGDNHLHRRVVTA